MISGVNLFFSPGICIFSFVCKVSCSPVMLYPEHAASLKVEKDFSQLCWRVFSSFCCVFQESSVCSFTLLREWFPWWCQVSNTYYKFSKISHLVSGDSELYLCTSAINKVVGIVKFTPLEWWIGVSQALSSWKRVFDVLQKLLNQEEIWICCSPQHRR